MASKFTIKSILIKFLKRHIYLFEKKKKVTSSWDILYTISRWRRSAKFFLLFDETSRNIEQPLVACWDDISFREATEPRHLFYHRSPLGPRVWRVVDNLSSSFLFTHFSFLRSLSNFPPFSSENLSPRLFIVSFLHFFIIR